MKTSKFGLTFLFLVFAMILQSCLMQKTRSNLKEETLPLIEEAVSAAIPGLMSSIAIDLIELLEFPFDAIGDLLGLEAENQPNGES